MQVTKYISALILSVFNPIFSFFRWGPRFVLRQAQDERTNCLNQGTQLKCSESWVKKLGLKDIFERSKKSFDKLRTSANHTKSNKNCYILGLCVATIMYAVPFHEKSNQQYTVVLDPAGDVKHTGRHIADVFERGLTLQCAEKIKEIIEERAPHIKVIITRMPGDTVYDLQNASLSNRIHAHLFIHISFYYTQETKPTLFLYQFSYGNDFASHQQGLVCHSYDQAYRINKEKTDMLCQVLRTELVCPHYHSLYGVKGPYALPLQPLIGIVAPAIACERGLKSKESWHSYAEPLAQGIINTLNN